MQKGCDASKTIYVGHVVFDYEVDQLPLLRILKTNEELEPAYPALHFAASLPVLWCCEHTGSRIVVTRSGLVSCQELAPDEYTPFHDRLHAAVMQSKVR